jgi:hypothetical protein
MRRYSHLGTKEEWEAVPPDSTRALVRAPADVTRWVADTRQKLDPDRCVTATFVVRTDGQLWIADRHSEHVACAEGGDVLSAGEMTFRVRGSEIEVVEVTNQSLGYCPEPESWPAVEAALAQAGIEYPDSFTAAFTFRRCSLDARGSVRQGPQRSRILRERRTVMTTKPSNPSLPCGAAEAIRRCPRGPH